MGAGRITTVTGFLTYEQDKADGTPVYGIETIGAHYWVAGDYSAYANKEVILQGVVGRSDVGLVLEVTSVQLSNRPLLTVNLLLDAARQLLGVPYRDPRAAGPWPVPMWRRDGMGDPPPVWHLQQVGVMASDLINYALEANGRPPGGAAGNFAKNLVKSFTFDPSSPGQPGAIAFAPSREGHIALYLGEHQLIQSIPSEGVTARYTDEETYEWASQGYPQYGFTLYGFLQGVSY
jgi:hypothetical protein